jgi:hypothetical protein
MDIKVGDLKMMRRTEVCGGDKNASAYPRLRTAICNFKMAYFDLFDIDQLENILHCPLAIDAGQFSLAISVDQDWCIFRT